MSFALHLVAAAAALVAQDSAPKPVPALPLLRPAGAANSVGVNAGDDELEYQALFGAWTAALDALEREARAAVAQKLPYENKVAHPDIVFYPLFDRLATKGSPHARMWCLRNGRNAGRSASDARLWRLDGCRKLADIRDQALVQEMLDWLGGLAHDPDAIDGVAALVLCRDLESRTRDESTRTAAINAQARITESSSAPDAWKEAADLYDKVAQRLGAGGGPGSASGAAAQAERASGAAFRLRFLRVGQRAPEFETRDVDGQPLKLSDFAGKLVMLDFWGFWCGPCRALLPHTKELIARFAGKPFVVVGVDTDKVLDWYRSEAKKNGVTWPMAFEPERALPRKWGVNGYPTVYLIDPKGVIRNVFVGVDEKVLDSAIDSLMAELR